MMHYDFQLLFKNPAKFQYGVDSMESGIARYEKYSRHEASRVPIFS